MPQVHVRPERYRAFAQAPRQGRSDVGAAVSACAPAERLICALSFPRKEADHRRCQARHHRKPTESPRRRISGIEFVAAVQTSSMAGKTTSWTSSCSAAAIGMAASAPMTPISSAPMRTATTVTPPDTFTARPMIFGVNR